jgi:hypothetical protein
MLIWGLSNELNLIPLADWSHYPVIPLSGVHCSTYLSKIKKNFIMWITLRRRKKNNQIKIQNRIFFWSEKTNWIIFHILYFLFLLIEFEFQKIKLTQFTLNFFFLCRTLKSGLSCKGSFTDLTVIYFYHFTGKIVFWNRKL